MVVVVLLAVVIVAVELGESALQHLPVERANLHRPVVVI